MKKIYCAGKFNFFGDWRLKVAPPGNGLFDAGEKIVITDAKRFWYTGPYFQPLGHGQYDHAKTFQFDLDAIRASDVLFAWIGADQIHAVIQDHDLGSVRAPDDAPLITVATCYGTFSEIGFAAGLGKEIWIATDVEDADLWFVRSFATHYRDGFTEAGEAFDWFVANHLPVDYHDYIRSDDWKLRATAAKERVGYKCQVCNRKGTKGSLHAHHRTYERLGQEAPEDITVLCANCHKTFHDNGKLAGYG